MRAIFILCFFQAKGEEVTKSSEERRELGALALDH